MTVATDRIASIADLRGRKVLVLGLARSGTAATRMLADSGALVTAYDRRSADQLGEAIAALGERRVFGRSDTDQRKAVARDVRQ